MKKTYTLAALAALTVGANAASIAITNGDFEAGAENPISTGWTDTSGNGRSFAHGGAASEILIGDGAGTDFVTTSFTLGALNTLAANSTYTIGFDYGNGSSTVAAGLTGTWTATLLTVGGDVLGSTDVSFTTTTSTSNARELFFNTNTRQHSGIAITTGASHANLGEELTIRLDNGTGDIAYMGFDNITLDVAAVPEPSSAALLGLGGLALILRRRK